MDKKVLVINFVVSFAAAYLALSLFFALHRPPRMMMGPGMFPPPRPMQYAPPNPR